MSKVEVVDTNNKSPVLGEGALLEIELLQLLEVELVELFDVEFVEVELLKVVEVGLFEVVEVDLVDFVATGSTTPTLTRAASITSHFLLTHFHLSFLKDGSSQTIPKRAPANCQDLVAPDTSLAAHLGHRSTRC